MKPAVKTVGMMAPIALAPLALMRAGESLLANPPQWEAAAGAVLLLGVLAGWFVLTAKSENVQSGIDAFDDPPTKEDPEGDDAD